MSVSAPTKLTLHFINICSQTQTLSCSLGCQQLLLHCLSQEVDTVRNVSIRLGHSTITTKSALVRFHWDSHKNSVPVGDQWW